MGGGPRSKSTQGGYSSDNDDNEHVTTHSSESDIDMVHVDVVQKPAGTSSATSNDIDKPQHILVYAKSKVYIHPTTYSRDNHPGWISIVKRGKADYLVSWIPESLLRDEEKDKLVKVEIGNDGKIQQEEVTLEERALDQDTSSSSLYPAKRLAWSVPLSALYSIVVTPPTLANWYGNVQVHLSESYTASSPSVNSPTHRLYFHDDESPSTMLMMDRRSAALAGEAQQQQNTRMPASWGGEDFVSALKRYSNVVKSSLQSHLYLINPSQADLEAHSVPLFEDELPNAHAIYNHRQQQQQSSSSNNNARNSILHQSLSPQASTSNTEALPSLDNLTFKVLSSFSKLTNQARHTARDFAQPILAHPRSKPILKHLPPAIASLANANAPEYSSWAEKAGVAGYDAARVYLARWARIVAEEGERARRSEMNFTSAARAAASGASSSAPGASGDFDVDDLGGPFEVLATTYRIQRPRSTRVQGNQPIVESEWQAWFDENGKLLLSASEARKRIFQRGLSDSARKSAWPFLLGVYEWESTRAEREKTYASRKKEYERMKDAWFGKTEVTSTEHFIEEHHRIMRLEIDCLRTDRNQPMFSSNAGTPTGLGESGQDMAAITSAQMAASSINTALRGDAGGQPASNYHTQKMVEILLTYNVHETELGYVQGMSDLCSPLYIVLEGDETLVFWSFANLMEERMKPNFYRDQSGIKHQLSLLQQLMALMDPQLHQHLESTDSLNLFFCFRWILIAFKREFKFDDCLAVWETLWSAPTKKFHLFLAMSILEKHRNIIIRYLKEFDEVLKYVNELSQTLEPQPLLCQAEVLYLGFKGLVETTDRRKSERASLHQGSESSAAGLRQRSTATSGSKEKASDKSKEKDPLIKLVRDEVDAEANVPDLEISDELRQLLKD